MLSCAQKFIDFMELTGAPFSVKEMDDGSVVVSCRNSGTKSDINVIFSGDDDGKHVGFRTVFDHCPKDRYPAAMVACNALNNQYRWLKFYLDDDGDIMVEDDAIVFEDSAAAECFELIARTVSILEEARPILMRVMYG